MNQVVRVLLWSNTSTNDIKSRIFLSVSKLHYRYIFIRRSEHMPMFNELFFNYGRNKVEWIEHLRYIGYKFAILVQGFGVDVPHPKYFTIFSVSFFVDRNLRFNIWMEEWMESCLLLMFLMYIFIWYFINGKIESVWRDLQTAW